MSSLIVDPSRSQSVIVSNKKTLLRTKKCADGATLNIHNSLDKKALLFTQGDKKPFCVLQPKQECVKLVLSSGKWTEAKNATPVAPVTTQLVRASKSRVHAKPVHTPKHVHTHKPTEFSESEESSSSGSDSESSSSSEEEQPQPVHSAGRHHKYPPQCNPPQCRPRHHKCPKDKCRNGKNGLNGLNGLNGKDGHDGRNGCKGDTGCRGPPGPPGPSGLNGVISAAYFYSNVLQELGTSDQPSSIVAFEEQSPVILDLNYSIDADRKRITVTNGGLYSITYIVAPANSSQFALQTPDGYIAGSNYGTNVITGNLTGTVIVRLRDAATVELQNIYSDPVTLAPQLSENPQVKNVTASISFIQLTAAQ